MRRIHYPDSIILLFIGFMIAFFAFVDAGYMIFQNQNYNKNSEKYTYKDMTVININNSEGDNIDILRTEQGNLSATGMSTMITNGQLHYMCTILMSLNEEPMYLMMEGSFFDKDSIKSDIPNVVIGKELMPATYKKEKKRYIDIEGEQYEVIGVTGDKYSDYNSSTLIFSYDSLGQNLKQLFDKQIDMEFMLQSNQCDTYEEATKLSDKIMNGDSSIKCAVSFIESTPIESSLSVFRYVVDILLFIFCLINCILISIYWMNKRIHEIAIRSLYGYSNLRLSGMLWCEIVIVILISAFITMLLHVIPEWFIHHQFIINQYYIVRGAILLLIFLVFVSVITIFYPIYYIKRIPMAEAIYWEG